MVIESRSRILIIDDSKSVRKLLCSRIHSLIDSEIETAENIQAAQQLLAADADRFYIAIVDLTLPDGPGGEIIDLVQQNGVPVVVLTGTLDDQVRDLITGKHIIDYFMKSNVSEVAHVADLIYRIYHNRYVKVLIVDDSKSYRYYLHSLLKVHQYQVIQACDGSEALRALEEHPDTRLVISDYYMPNMDGLEMITRIRKRKSRNELAILGVSEAGDERLPAKLLKSGANDFVTKPLIVEEFYCRVTHSIDTIEHIRQIEESATRDYLTRCYNRRYLFEIGQRLYDSSKRGKLPMAAAMIDADHFKLVNDRYGHPAGDKVLQSLASILHQEVRQSDLVARFGGEEFCILATNLERKGAVELFERVRKAISEMSVQTDSGEITVSVSIGVSMSTTGTLTDMLNLADNALYSAKQQGRNLVVIDTRGS